MNILHIHTTDRLGGAAVSMYRLHEALRRRGVGSRILCGYKITLDPDVQEIMRGSSLGRRLNRDIGGMFHRCGWEAYGYPASRLLKNHPWLTGWADVVMVRNLHGGYLSLESLLDMAQRCSVVWRLPDMWPLTGHCTYSHGCERWLIGCGDCARLSEPPALRWDTTAWMFERKRRIYSKIKGRLHVVSPSLWLKGLVERSPLFEGLLCHHIPTAVDLNVFKPLDKKQARRFLGIPEDGLMIMVSGFHLNDPRKKINEILNALDLLRQDLDVPLHCLIVGTVPPHTQMNKDAHYMFTGRVDTDDRLNLCYNAADVFVHLSTADNMPNTLVEAAAAGCPAITSRVGGCPEVVVDEITGFVVAGFDALIHRLKQLLINNALRAHMGRAARQRAEECFGMDKQVRSYLALIDQVINQGCTTSTPAAVYK